MEYNSIARKSYRPTMSCKMFPTPLTWIALLAFSIISLYVTFIYMDQDTNTPLRNYLCSHTLTTETDFTAHKEFQDMSPASDKYWADLLPRNGGFLAPENTGKRAPGIAMFHQLHCLQMIRSSMQSLLGKNNTEARGMHHHDAHDAIDEHVLHCFDYIRQVCGCS